VYSLTTDYEFQGKANGDGADPETGIILDSSDNLYGTTFSGGATGCSGGCGTIFKLEPCTNLTCTSRYKENWLYEFSAAPEYFVYPTPTSLTEDSSGNLYGATEYGGDAVSGSSTGTVFETSASSGSTSTIFTLPGSPDGSNPGGGMVIGSGGDLYGVTLVGDSHGNGVIYRLSSSQARGKAHMHRDVQPVK
jgi:uncharacterized repeat protein (TIGR03803 family)